MEHLSEQLCLQGTEYYVSLRQTRGAAGGCVGGHSCGGREESNVCLCAPVSGPQFPDLKTD